MAQVNLNIRTQGGKQATQTLGQLESRAEELNKQIRQVGKNSKEFQQLQKELSNVNSQIKSTQESFEGLSFEDKGRALADVAGGATQAFGSLQVVLADSNSNVQELIATSVKYLQVAEGIRGVTEATSQGLKLYRAQLKSLTIAQKAQTFVTQGATKATRLFRGALLATGIGAVIALIGTLIANFDSIKSYLGSQIPGVVDSFKANFMGVFNVVKQPVQAFLGIWQDILTLDFSSLISKLKALGSKILGIFTSPIETIKSLGNSISSIFEQGKQKQAAANAAQRQAEQEKKILDSLNKQLDKIKQINDDELTKQENLQNKLKALNAERNRLLSEGKLTEEALKQIEAEREQILSEIQDNTVANLEADAKLAKSRGNNRKALELELKALQEQQRTLNEGSVEYKEVQADINNKQQELNELVKKQKEKQEDTEQTAQDKLDTLQAQIVKLKRQENTELQIQKLKIRQAEIEQQNADSELDRQKAITRKKEAQSAYNKELEKQLKLTGQALSGNFGEGLGGSQGNGGGNTAGGSGSQGQTGEQDSGPSGLNGQLARAVGADTQTVAEIRNQASGLANEISSIGQQRRQQELRAEKQKLEEQRKAALDNENLTEKQRQRINQKFDKKQKKLEKEQFKRKKKVDTQEAIANGALAITKALTQTGGEPIQTAIRTALITATTAAQVSKIQSRKFKAKQGGVVDGPSHEQGGVKGTGKFNNVEVEGGEYVINRDSTQKYKPVLDAINQGKYASGGVLPSQGSNDTNKQIRDEIKALRQEQGQNQGAPKAIVVEEDISDKQEKQRTIERKARL